MNIQPPTLPDSAAVYSIAASLDEYAHAFYVSQISDAYQGADEFYRQSMRVADAFERWACVHVDFDGLPECWPYMLREKFAKVLDLKTGGILSLYTIAAEAWPVIAEGLGLVLLPVCSEYLQLHAPADPATLYDARAVCKSALCALRDNLSPGPMDADAKAALVDFIAKTEPRELPPITTLRPVEPITPTIPANLASFRAMASELLQALPSMTKPEQADNGIKALGLAYIGLDGTASEIALAQSVYDYASRKAIEREADLVINPPTNAST